MRRPHNRINPLIPALFAVLWLLAIGAWFYLAHSG